VRTSFVKIGVSTKCTSRVRQWRTEVKVPVAAVEELARSRVAQSERDAQQDHHHVIAFGTISLPGRTEIGATGSADHPAITKELKQVHDAG
jgi:hypothetical protein